MYVNRCATCRCEMGPRKKKLTCSSRCATVRKNAHAAAVKKRNEEIAARLRAEDEAAKA